MKWYWILLIVIAGIAVGLLISKLVKSKSHSEIKILPVVPKPMAPVTTTSTTTSNGTVETKTNDVTGQRTTTIDTTKKY